MRRESLHRRALESGHVLVAMTSPYASTAAGGRGWNANYSMMAWEVAPSGTVLSEVNPRGGGPRRRAPRRARGADERAKG